MQHSDHAVTSTAEFLDHPLREPLDGEEREFMNPDTWDCDNVQEAIVEPSSYSITEVRLSYDMTLAHRGGRDRRGDSVNAYLRGTALRSASAWSGLNDRIFRC